MTREDAILWLQVLKHSKINWVGEQAEDEDIIARCEEAEQEAFCMAIEALSADAVQGEWIDEDGNNVPLHKDGYPLRSCYCNQCHEWLVASDEYEVKGNFCPNCGAKMNGGAE